MSKTKFRDDCYEYCYNSFWNGTAWVYDASLNGFGARYHLSKDEITSVSKEPSHFLTMDGQIIPVVSYEDLFYEHKELTKINCENWDLSGIKNTSGMFSCCFGLTELNLSKWDMSNVEDASEMFYCCLSLRVLNFNNWNVSKIKDISNMFFECHKLEELDFSTWSTITAANMNELCYGCLNLKVIDLSGQPLEQVVLEPIRIIQSCRKLQVLDISTWHIACNMGINSWIDEVKQYNNDLQFVFVASAQDKRLFDVTVPEICKVIIAAPVKRLA